MDGKCKVQMRQRRVNKTGPRQQKTDGRGWRGGLGWGENWQKTVQGGWNRWTDEGRISPLACCEWRNLLDTCGHSRHIRGTKVSDLMKKRPGVNGWRCRGCRDNKRLVDLFIYVDEYQETVHLLSWKKTSKTNGNSVLCSTLLKKKKRKRHEDTWKEG